MTQIHQTPTSSFSINPAILIGLFVAILFGVVGSTAAVTPSTAAASSVYLPVLMTPVVFEAVAQSATYGAVTDIANAGDDRLFIAQQDGIIKVQQADGTATTFLDISSKIKLVSWEQGLLGMTFHPDFATNGFFYVLYTGFGPSDSNAYLNMVRYQVSADSNVADPASENSMWRMIEDGEIHNGGALRFGPDGYLYMGVGDDFQVNAAQDGASRKGSVSRFSPESLIKPNGSRAIALVWVMGVRNPWRIAFDDVTNTMFIGDVGKNTAEEINATDLSTRFINLGWPCEEGNVILRDDDSFCGNFYTRPIHSYPHENGRCSITLGEVMRDGDDLSILYADFCSGEIFQLESTDGGWESSILGSIPQQLISTFGRGHDGTIYVGSYDNGPIYKLIIP